MDNTDNSSNLDGFTPITRSLIAEASRMNATHTLFGLHFPLRLEPTVFTRVRHQIRNLACF